LEHNPPAGASDRAPADHSRRASPTGKTQETTVIAADY